MIDPGLSGGGGGKLKEPVEADRVGMAVAAIPAG